MNLEIIKILEILLYVALALFISTTVYLIKAVKNRNIELIQKAVTNPILPNLNLSFFSELRDEFYKIKKSKTLIYVNKASFYFLLIGLTILFILVILKELNIGSDLIK